MRARKAESESLLAKNKPSCITEASLVYTAALTAWDPTPKAQHGRPQNQMASLPCWPADQCPGIACLPHTTHFQIHVS